MKIKHAAIIGLSAIATLFFAAPEIPANAHGSGFGMHSFHFGNHFRPVRHSHLNRNFNQWPWYGGYGGLYAMPPYDYNNGSYVEPTVVFVSQPPSALSCQTSKEIKTVPAEGGGTRDITITRC
jgi:hypothetical protein